MIEGGEDEEEWDVFDASAHVQPKRRRMTLASDEGGDPQKKVASTVLRLEDGAVVMSLGDIFLSGSAKRCIERLHCQRGYAAKPGQRIYGWGVEYARRSRRWCGGDTAGQDD